MMPVFVWTLSEVVWLTVVALALIVAFIIKACTMIRMSRCKHDGGVNETGACNAICRQCGVNLGFIGAWRKKQKRERLATSSAAKGEADHG